MDLSFLLTLQHYTKYDMERQQALIALMSTDLCQFSFFTNSDIYFFKVCYTYSPNNC
jgi:hypothetical protein